jgi:hypothetical protein
MITTGANVVSWGLVVADKSRKERVYHRRVK